MTRREWLSTPLWLSLAGRLRAMPGDFPGVRYREYARCLPDFLRELATRSYEARNRAIAALTSKEAIQSRQKWVRETFWQIAGGQPSRTPLNLHTTGSFERSGYRVEKLIYESVPKLYITANLYIPVSGQPPYPAVLFQMGHTSNGKAGDTYQRCCQGLAKLGFLVLGFDPMGQGERINYPDSSGRHTRVGSPDDEHNMAGKQMLLTGDTATRMQVWDAVRSLDVLAAHPMADPQRLGVTGQSGGGTLTMLLLAVDDRLSAAVVCSGNTENVACADFNPPGSTDDAEQNLVGSSPLGFDRWDLLYPFAPKPLLIAVSDLDFIATYSREYIRNGWEEFQKLRSVYTRLNAADHLAWADTPLPHGLSYDLRLQVYNWFGHWLRQDAALVTVEPEVHPEPEQALWATETGNVIRSLGSERPFTLNRAQLLPVRPEPLAQLTGAERPPAGLRATVLGRATSHRIAIEALEVPSAPHVWLPAWLYLPATPDTSKPVLLALDPGGRNTRWHEGELYPSLARQGYAVCVADIRGAGDLAPEVGRGPADYARFHAGEDSYAWASLIFGKPLLGQRITDILALAAALRALPALHSLRFRVAARGSLTVPALFAAALDPAIAELYLAGGLISYRSIVETEEYRAPFANFVPGIVLHTDLPATAAAIAPRRVRLAGMVNAAGDALDTSAVRAIYGNHAHIEVRPEAKWDAQALTSHGE